MGLFYYCFPWTEGEDPLRLNPDNTRFARNRITSDVKLDGMTDPKNVKVEVIEPGDKVKVTLRIQDEFLTTRRTVIQVGGRGFGQGGFTDTQAALSNRVTSNQNRLNDLIAEHSGTVQVVTLIDLPKRCESQFTTRDDFGNEGAKKGLVFGCYEQAFQRDGLPPQFMHVLHIQLLVKEHVVAMASNPSGVLYSPVVGRSMQQWQQFQQQQQQQQQQYQQ